MKPATRVIASVVIIALLGLWLASIWRQSPDPKQVPPAPSETAMGEPAADADEGRYNMGHPVRVRARTVASILAGRRNVLEGLTEALAVFGPKDPDLISAAGMALAACGEARNAEHFMADPRNGLQDSRKLEALEKLQIQCEGFDGSAFFRQLDTFEHKAVDDALMQSNSDNRLATEQRVIATSVNTRHLSTAGYSWIRHKRLPLGEIFGPQATPDWQQLSGNWALAAELSTCSRQLGCGPDALPTLVICMQLGGCEPGQGYEKALENGLPAEDFRAVLAFRQWIARQRR